MSEALRIGALNKALILLIEESKDYYSQNECNCKNMYCTDCRDDENFNYMIQRAEKVLNAGDDGTLFAKEMQLVDDVAPYVVDPKPMFSVNFGITPAADGKQTISITYEPGIYGDGIKARELSKLSNDERQCYIQVANIGCMIFDILEKQHDDN